MPGEIPGMNFTTIACIRWIKNVLLHVNILWEELLLY
jgi:hypothetical protein